MRSLAAVLLASVGFVGLALALPSDTATPDAPKLLREDGSRILYNGKIYVLEVDPTPRPTSGPSQKPTSKPTPAPEDCEAEKALTPSDGMEFWM